LLNHGAPVLWLCAGAAVAQSHLCEPPAEIREKIEAACRNLEPAHLGLEGIEPLQTLRRQLPHDFFVHTRYQDLVNERGVEGELKEMFEEYMALRTRHPDSALHLYLYGRALEGRSTPQAISIIEEVLSVDAGFAPAHRTLAEIYGSARFHDPAKEEIERAKFSALCPSGVIPSRPIPLPPAGDLGEAERLVFGTSAAEVPRLVYQAMQQDAWRL